MITSETASKAVLHIAVSKCQTQCLNEATELIPERRIQFACNRDEFGLRIGGEEQSKE